MSIATPVYNQLLNLLNEHSQYRDLRHLKALAWMINALLCSGTINLSEWESYVSSRAEQAQSTERTYRAAEETSAVSSSRRWQRFLRNHRIRVRSLYVPLVMAAISNWQGQRLYLALDTTMLWNRFCIIHLSVVCCGRAIPFLWKVKEHSLCHGGFWGIQINVEGTHIEISLNILISCSWQIEDLRTMRDVSWLQDIRWHYCLRLPCDVTLHGPRRYPIELMYLWPPLGEAVLYHNVGLWLDGESRCNIVLANVKGVKEPWAVITDQEPSLQTLWQYGLRFRVEELFLDSKSGAFELEESRIRDSQSLERLYLVVALALLFATTQGMAVQIQGLRTQVDPHWKRGLSYLKIGLRWLKGVLHKGGHVAWGLPRRSCCPCRALFSPVPLLPLDPQPCFSSKKAKKQYYDAIWFSRIRELKCRA